MKISMLVERGLLANRLLLIGGCRACTIRQQQQPRRRWYTSGDGFGTVIHEIGRLETPKLQGRYSAGQLFLHRVFGYRGIILFPWVAKLYDRDVENNHIIKDDKDECYVPVNGQPGKPSDWITYYQVLVNEDDYPELKLIMPGIEQTGAVTFKDPTTNMIKALPGLDYVSHEDILPYSSNNIQPIKNASFDKFLALDKRGDKQEVKFATTTGVYHLQNMKSLEVSAVYRQTTEDVRVTAIPFYIGAKKEVAGGSKMQGGSHLWRYNVRLENFNKSAVQLLRREWHIHSHSSSNGSDTDTDDTNSEHTTRDVMVVSGQGVIGFEPLLSPEIPAFQYSSHVDLHSSHGYMDGSFMMQRSDESTFFVKIPGFDLISDVEETQKNNS